MTDLFLGDESKEYQNLAQDFFQNEAASKSEKLDHDAVFPKDLYKAAWELGLATTLIPEKFGGLGLSLWDCAVMAEEAGAASGGVAAIFEGNALAIAPVLFGGSEEQKETYLGKLCAEASLASYCFAGSSDGGSFPLAAASYRKSGDKYILSADNLVALNGENASWYVVLAQLENSDASSVFIFDKNLPGITCGAQLSKLGRKCADICSIDFKNVELNNSNLLGKEGNGKNLILESSCISAAIIAAHATGLMRSALEHSLRYSKERQTFGKPIGKHQAVGFMMADIAKSAQCARLMTWKAASLYDNGSKDYIQALSAKAFAVDAAIACATDAVQIYGGYGYSKEYPVERLMRDAKMMQMMAGSSFEIKCKIGEEQLALSAK